MNRARTPEEEARYQELLREVYKRISQRKFYRYKPYPWQEEFHNAGGEHSERMLMAANRVGKTYSGAFEMAAHLTGDYPDWWKGKRFSSGVTAWAATLTNENLRDIVQKELLGEPWGTGTIPGERIIGDPKTRQAGVSNVVDHVKVSHKRGVSVLTFKTYEQGWRKFQGTAQDVIWLDEEPDDYNIFSECETRILTTKGVLYVTFTPLLGETDLVLHFRDHGFLMGATWEQAPHLGVKERNELAGNYRDHEREARMYGIPMMGEGRVFTSPPEQYTCEPFEIPRHFARIAGVDFGWDHPAASAWIAYDRDNDVVYVYDCYRKSKETPAYHAFSLNQRGRWIPVSWPHDGLNKEKSGGDSLMDQYRGAGANMLGFSARYDNEKGGAQAQEPIVQEVEERMNTGRFKVFSHLSDWFQEARNYHRKDGKLVDKGEDILKATFYAVMMKRFAMSEIEAHAKPRKSYSRPILE